MDRIGRIGHDDDVARRGDRLRDVGEAFLRAERGDDLRFGIELHAEAARVISGLGAAQPGNSLGRRIAVGARLADGLLQLLDHVRRRRQVGIAHAEIDDVGAAVARRRLGAIDLLEHVRRQAADAVKFFHGCPERVGSTYRPEFYHGLVSAPAVSGAVGSGGADRRGARHRRRLFRRAGLGVGRGRWRGLGRGSGSRGGLHLSAQMVALGDQAIGRLLDLARR